MTQPIAAASKLVIGMELKNFALKDTLYPSSATQYISIWVWQIHSSLCESAVVCTCMHLCTNIAVRKGSVYVALQTRDLLYVIYRSINSKLVWNVFSSWRWTFKSNILLTCVALMRIGTDKLFCFQLLTSHDEISSHADNTFGVSIPD